MHLLAIVTILVCLVPLRAGAVCGCKSLDKDMHQRFAALDKVFVATVEKDQNSRILRVRKTYKSEVPKILKLPSTQQVNCGQPDSLLANGSTYLIGAESGHFLANDEFFLSGCASVDEISTVNDLVKWLDTGGLKRERLKPPPAPRKRQPQPPPFLKKPAHMVQPSPTP